MEVVKANCWMVLIVIKTSAYLWDESFFYVCESQLYKANIMTKKFQIAGSYIDDGI